MRLSDDYEVIIVDNASSDHTEEVMEGFKDKEGPRLVYLRNDINTGFGRANNQGYKVSKGDYILFLNNDIRVKDNYTDWPELLIKHCEDGSIVGAQAGMLDGSFNFVKEGQFDPNQKGAYLSGWCMMASRETWDSLILDQRYNWDTQSMEGKRAGGPWNENYFLYFEDGDVSWRVKENGGKLIILNDLPLHHFSRVTGKKFNMFHFFHKSRRIFKKDWANIR